MITKYSNYEYRRKQINETINKIYYLEKDIKQLIRDLKLLSIQNGDLLDVAAFLKGRSLETSLTKPEVTK